MDSSIEALQLNINSLKKSINTSRSSCCFLGDIFITFKPAISDVVF